jgi:hypothetical protein
MTSLLLLQSDDSQRPMPSYHDEKNQRLVRAVLYFVEYATDVTAAAAADRRGADGRRAKAD